MPKTTPKKDAAKKFINRREFVGAAAGAIVAPMIIPASARGADGHVAPSNRITVAQIGMGRMGRGHTRRLVLDPGVEFLAVCDVDRTRRLKAKEAVDSYSQGSGSSCKDYNDYRDVLARDDIDAVVIVTPDHWHAPISIHAAEAGKDVYCEKPISLTVNEGRQLAQAVQRHGRTFQNGSQYRTRPDVRRPCEFIRKGGLGKIKSLFTTWGGFHWIHRDERFKPFANVFNLPVTESSLIPLNFALPAEPVPEGLDWDLWLGPAPWQPYNSSYHVTEMRAQGVPWSFSEDFSVGASTRTHSHSAEVGQWAIGLEEAGPVEIFHPSSGEYPTLTFRYANGVLHHLVQGWGPVKTAYGAVPDDAEIEGNFGAVVVGERGWLTTMSNNKTTAPITGGPTALMEEYNRPEHDIDMGGIDHHANWLQCIKSREKPFSHEEIGHRAASLGQLAIIGYKLGRSLKFDPEREVFPEDKQANRLLRRAKRAPWHI